MIESLTLENLQSHEDVTLGFAPGVNVIVGSSNSGKSALLRGLYWIAYNRPSGLGLVSWWNLEKDAPKAETAARITLSDGRSVSRVRSKTFNGYVVDGKRLEAVGTDVPDEIAAFLNLSETNISRQMDAPFLVSESAGEVARYFNRIVRLDLIDRVLSDADGQKRKAKADIAATTVARVRADATIAEYDWIDEAETLLAGIERQETRMAAGISDRQKLVGLSETRKEENARWKRLDILVSTAAPVVDLIVAAEAERARAEDSRRKLTLLVAAVRAFRKTIAAAPDFSRVEELIQKIEAVVKKLVTAKSRRGALDSNRISRESVVESIERFDRTIAEASSKLPKTCPLCGAALEGGTR